MMYASVIAGRKQSMPSSRALRLSESPVSPYVLSQRGSSSVVCLYCTFCYLSVFGGYSKCLNIICPNNVSLFSNVFRPIVSLNETFVVVYVSSAKVRPSAVPENSPNLYVFTEQKTKRGNIVRS